MTFNSLRQRTLSKHTLLIVFVLFLGMLFRFSHLFFIHLDEPFQLGGLFWEFSHQIRIHHYLLPANIPYYSAGGIPFAYPPLAFYLEALVTDLFHTPVFWIPNILPPLLASLCLPSFYCMSLRITGNRAIALISLLIYTFTPNSFLNQIQAGGLAEALGSLALIWFGYFLADFYAERGRMHAIRAGIFLAICILASPGSALAAVVISVVFALLLLLSTPKAKFVYMLIDLGLIGLTGLVISAPYWLTVMAYHGRGIFLVSLLGQVRNDDVPFYFQTLERLLFFDVSGGGYPFLWNVLFFAGLIWAVFKRRWLLSALFLVLFLIPREGVWMSPILAATLAGSSIVEWFSPQFNELLQAYRWRTFLAGGVIAILCAGLLYASYESLHEMIYDSQARVTSAQILDLEQARQVIPAGAQVIVLGTDGLVEWSPSILQREVLNVKYGLEWQPVELARVQELLRAISAAQGWPEIFQAVHSILGVDRVYVIGDKRRLSALSRGSGIEADLFLPLMDFSSLEVGLLSTDHQ